MEFANHYDFVIVGGNHAPDTHVVSHAYHLKQVVQLVAPWRRGSPNQPKDLKFYFLKQVGAMMIKLCE